MCGRYTISVDPRTYREFYDYPEQPNFPPRYNVAPTQPVPIVLEDRGERHFMLVRWGFLPSWVKDPKDFPLVINARGETLQTKPTFKAALKRRRCIFLADGFYEWQRHGREKIPVPDPSAQPRADAAGRPVGDLQQSGRRRDRHRRHRHHGCQRHALGRARPHAGDPVTGRHRGLARRARRARRRDALSCAPVPTTGSTWFRSRAA